LALYKFLTYLLTSAAPHGGQNVVHVAAGNIFDAAS